MVQHMKINWFHHINGTTTGSHMIYSTDAEKKPLTNLACFHNKTSKSLGIKMNILHIIRAYITKKNTQVIQWKKTENSLPHHTLTLGTRQGHLLIPLLFNIVLGVLVKRSWKKKKVSKLKGRSKTFSIHRWHNPIYR